MRTEDNLLLEQLKCGSINAFKQLFEKYYSLLSSYAFYFLDDEMEAEDTVQNLFIEIWDKKLYNNIHSSLKSYLLTAVHNRCFNIIQKRKTVKKQLDQYAHTLYKKMEVEPEYYATYTSMTMVLDALPSQQSLAFNLVHLEDKKYKEAAKEMAISINSLKTHLKLAVKGLRKQLVGSATFNQTHKIDYANTYEAYS